MTDTRIRVLIADDDELIVTELSRQLPACASVILTGHGRPYVLRQALTSGARGFLAKGAPSAALADVVRRVHEGQCYVDPILAADALTDPLTIDSAGSGGTPRSIMVRRRRTRLVRRVVAQTPLACRLRQEAEEQWTFPGTYGC